MRVQETLDGIAELRKIKGIQVGGVIVNMARPALLAGDLHEDLNLPALAAALAAAGLGETGQLAADLAAELAEHADRVELQDRERAELDAAGQPIYELPLITQGIDPAAPPRHAAPLPDPRAPRAHPCT